MSKATEADIFADTIEGVDELRKVQKRLRELQKVDHQNTALFCGYLGMAFRHARKLGISDDELLSICAILMESPETRP